MNRLFLLSCTFLSLSQAAFSMDVIDEETCSNPGRVVVQLSQYGCDLPGVYSSGFYSGSPKMLGLQYDAQHHSFIISGITPENLREEGHAKVLSLEENDQY